MRDGGARARSIGRFIVLRERRLDEGTEEVPGTNPFLDLTLNGPVFGGPPVYDPADPTGPGTDFNSFGTEDRFNFGPFNYLQIPLKRLGAFANVKYEIADNINFSAKGIWNQRKSKNRAAPLPFGVGAAAGITPVLDGIDIDVSNPFNPYGVTLDETNMALVYRRFIEGGPPVQSDEKRLWIATSTELRLGGNEWFWDINASWPQQGQADHAGNINSNNLRTLGPVLPAPPPPAARRSTSLAASEPSLRRCWIT